MGTRLTTIHGATELAGARHAVMVLALVMALGATSASAASPTACRVRNTNTGKTYTALQAAVDAASKGDRLTVRGTCHGGARSSTRSLVIEGIETPTSGSAILDGDHRTRVLLIAEGVRVKLRDLVIRDGRASVRQMVGSRAAVSQRPDLRPNGRRHPEQGTPGPRRCRRARQRRGCRRWHHNGGTLVLRGRSLISRNVAHADGGGIYSMDGRVTLDDSSRVSETAPRRLWRRHQQRR